MTAPQRHVALAAAILLSFSLLSSPASADEEIVVIVAQGMPELRLDPSTLRDIYLKKIFLDDHDQEFIPLNLPPDHVLRRIFSLALFNKDPQELQNYWNQRYFHGITPPYVLASPQAVVQFVGKTPGAIGYVTSCDLDPSVKRVLSLPVPPSEHAALAKLCSQSPAADASTPHD